MSRPTDFQNLEVSKRGAHFLHLAFQGGRRAPLPLRQLRHCLQAFCDRASSACGRNQRSLTFWTKIKIFIIDAVGNVEVHHTIIIFRGIECTWPWGRLQLFRRSPHSRNTGSVSCNSCACCTVPKMRKMQDQIEIAEKHYVILQHFFGNILSSMRSTKRPKMS